MSKALVRLSSGEEQKASEQGAVLLDHLPVGRQALPGDKLLEEAVAAHRVALEVYTRESQPQDWALVQGNLGEVLRELGHRTPGEAGVALLSASEEAWLRALAIYTREQPEDHEWARQELEKTRQLQTQRGQTVRSE